MEHLLDTFKKENMNYPEDREELDLEEFDVYEIALDCFYKGCNAEPTHYDRGNHIFVCEDCIRKEIKQQI